MHILLGNRAGEPVNTSVCMCVCAHVYVQRQTHSPSCPTSYEKREENSFCYFGFPIPIWFLAKLRLNQTLKELQDFYDDGGKMCLYFSGIKIIVFILMMVSILIEQALYCMFMATHYYAAYGFFNVDLNEIQSKIWNNKN